MRLTAFKWLTAFNFNIDVPRGPKYASTYDLKYMFLKSSPPCKIVSFHAAKVGAEQKPWYEGLSFLGFDFERISIMLQIARLKTNSSFSVLIFLLRSQDYLWCRPEIKIKEVITYLVKTKKCT